MAPNQQIMSRTLADPLQRGARLRQKLLAHRPLEGANATIRMPESQTPTRKKTVAGAWSACFLPIILVSSRAKLQVRPADKEEQV